MRNTAVGVGTLNGNGHRISIRLLGGHQPNVALFRQIRVGTATEQSCGSFVCPLPVESLASIAYSQAVGSSISGAGGVTVRREIFLSHSSIDSELASRVCQALEAAGITCWIAPRDIAPGRPYTSEVLQAIEDSDGLVLLLSESANRSPHVHREVERAGSNQKPIYPVRLQKVIPVRELEYFIATAQWTDALEPPLEMKLVPVIEAIQIARNRIPCAPAPSPQPQALAETPVVSDGSRSGRHDEFLWLVMLPQGRRGFTLLPIKNLPAVVGRSYDADVVLPSTMVSLKHARLERLSDRWHCTDLGSTCGTFVNGRNALHTVIRTGDMLRFGDARTLVLVGPGRNGFGLPSSETVEDLLKKAAAANKRLPTGCVDMRVYASAVAVYDDQDYRQARFGFAATACISRTLGLAAEDRLVLMYASLLSGIGRAHVFPDGSPTRRWTPDEVSQVRSSTFRMLAPLSDRPPFADVVRLLTQFFEDPKAGAPMVVVLRLGLMAGHLCVDRPYRPRMSADQAWALLVRDMNDDFLKHALTEPVLKDTFKALMLAEWPEMEAEIEWTDPEGYWETETTIGQIVRLTD